MPSPFDQEDTVLNGPLSWWKGDFVLWEHELWTDPEVGKNLRIFWEWD